MDQAHPNRRAFLKAGGLGVAAVGVGALADPSPAEAAWVIPFALDLRQHFGAKGDGVTDDTAAIQAAFAAFNNTAAGIKGMYLYVPPGDYLITDTVRITRFAGVIQGPGVGNTHNYAPGSNGGGLGACFRWGGTRSGIPMFRLRDTRHISFRDLRFVGNDAAVPSAALNFHNGGSDTVGTNTEVSIQDCVFGVWPWNHDGNYTGRIEHGILYDGVNTDNDKFRIHRCSFRGPTGFGAGITIRSTQSVWGSITDCLFRDLRVGISTASATTVNNPGFFACRTDLELHSTAQVDVFAWNSENASQLAKVSRYGGLRAVGGNVQIVPSRVDQMSGGVVDAFPSGYMQTVSFTGTRFFWPAGENVQVRPTIRFGPSPPIEGHPDGVPSGHEGFLVKIEDCIGLHASQCELRGTMTWASEPRSRGLVEWYSRNHFGGVVQFRNELWNGSQPGTRTTVNPNVWDPPIPGTTD